MPTFVANTAYTISGTFSDTLLDHTTPTSRIGKNLLQTYTSGTGSNQANQWWADRRTLAATSENLDLFGGLTDAFGNTINFVTVKEIAILNRSTTAADFLLISGTALAGMASGNIVVWASGRWVLSAPLNGFTIVDAGQDILTVDAGASTITYDIFLIGRV
jgi:hypothetical protein